MKFGFDVRGITHQPAGKGWYTLQLLNYLATCDKENSYHLFSDRSIDLPFSLNRNFIRRVERGLGPWWHIHTAGLLEEEEFDGYLSSLSYLVPALTSVSVLLVVHDLAVFTHPQTSTVKVRMVERWALGRALAHSAQVVCDSRSTRADLFELVRRYQFQLKSEPEVVYPGLHPDYQHKVSQREQKRIAKKYGLESHFLLFVGTIEPRKNIGMLLEALWLLPQELREQYPLLLVGKKGWKYGEVFSAIRHLNLEATVRYLDYLPQRDLPGLYAGATACIFPSLSEGFGFPVVEAMACGAPVIASKAGSLPEVVGRAGLLVPPDDPKVVMMTIERLLRSLKLQQKLRRLGRVQSERFRWSETGRRIHELLLEIDSNKR